MEYFAASLPRPAKEKCPQEPNSRACLLLFNSALESFSFHTKYGKGYDSKKTTITGPLPDTLRVMSARIQARENRESLYNVRNDDRCTSLVADAVEISKAIFTKKNMFESWKRW